jgi:hypothetical protein
MTEIKWSEKRVKLKELVPWGRNPRRTSSAQAGRLKQSFEEFGQVETIAIGPKRDVYNGHQRLKALLEKHGPDYEIDAWMSFRALIEKEREKLTIYLHHVRRTTAEFAVRFASLCFGRAFYGTTDSTYNLRRFIYLFHTLSMNRIAWVCE